MISSTTTRLLRVLIPTTIAALMAAGFPGIAVAESSTDRGAGPAGVRIVERVPVVDSQAGVGDRLTTDPDAGIALTGIPSGHDAALIRLSIFEAETELTVSAAGSPALFIPEGTSASTTVLVPIVGGSVNLYGSVEADLRVEVLATFAGDPSVPGSVIALPAPINRGNSVNDAQPKRLGTEPLSVAVTGFDSIPAAGVRGVWITATATLAAATTINVGGQVISVGAGTTAITTTVAPEADGTIDLSLGSGIADVSIDVRGWIPDAADGAAVLNVAGSMIPKSDAETSTTAASDSSSGIADLGASGDEQFTLALISAAPAETATVVDIGAGYEGRSRGAVIDPALGALPQLVLSDAGTALAAVTVRRGDTTVAYLPVAGVRSLEAEPSPSPEPSVEPSPSEPSPSPSPSPVEPTQPVPSPSEPSPSPSPVEPTQPVPSPSPSEPSPSPSPVEPTQPVPSPSEPSPSPSPVEPTQPVPSPSPSEPVPGVVPGPVVDLVAGEVTESGVELSWVVPAGGDVGASVVIRRAEGDESPGGPDDGDHVVTLSTGLTSFTDTFVEPGTTYTYAVFLRDEDARESEYRYLTVTTPGVDRCEPEGIRVVEDIEEDTVWSDPCLVYAVDQRITIRSRATLTIQPGVHIEFNPGGSLTIEGSLVALGTAGKPVVFTSGDEDLGGSELDGSQNLPSQTRWGGFILADGASVDLSRVEVHHTDELFDFSLRRSGSERVRVVDSVLNTRVWLFRLDRPVLERNVVRSPDAAGLSLSEIGDLSGVPLSGPDVNTLVGDVRARLVRLESSAVAAGTRVDLAMAGGVSAYEVTNGRVDGELHLEPGVITKSMGVGTWTVQNGGSLVAHGDPGLPVVFTVYWDESFGGDTDVWSDPGSEVRNPAWWTIGIGDGASVDLSRVEVHHTDELFDFSLRRSGSERVRVVDSVLNTRVWLFRLDRPVLERNVVRSPDAAGLSLSEIGDLSGVPLSGPDVNTLVGDVRARLVRLESSAVAAGTRVDLAMAGGVSAYEVTNGRVDGELHLEPGVITKVIGRAWTVARDGSLVASGDEGVPVVFTVYWDDTYGGDTDVWSDESSVDSPSEWLVQLNNGASVDLSRVEVHHTNQLFHYGSGCCGFRGYFPDNIRVVDSLLNTQLNVMNVNRPILERNTIHSAHPRGLLLSGVEDTASVALSGANVNTLLGDAQTRIVALESSGIPVGSSAEWSTDSGVSAYEVTWVDVAGSLTLNPGVVVKVPSGSRGLAVGGTISAVGEPDFPIVFTSTDDAAFGGDTNWVDGRSGPAQRLLRIESRGQATGISYVVFANSDTAVSVGELVSLTINDSKFVRNEKAFEVDEIGTFDPTIGYFWNTLPCTPPYSSEVIVNRTWFGQARVPGFPIGTETELFREEIPHPILKNLFDAMTDQYEDRVSLSILNNTAPWTVYECTVGTPPITIRIPVTPVIVGVIAFSDWLPEYTE